MLKQLILPFFLLIATAALGAGPETTIIFVNPAEEEASPVRDPGLSANGQQQAGLLQQALADTEVAAIYSTYLNCAVQTVEPLAKSKGIKVDYYRDSNPDILESVITALLKKHKGQTIVVCGTPANVPAMMRLAGIKSREVRSLYDKASGQGLVVKVNEEGSVVAQKLNMNFQKKV